VLSFDEDEVFSADITFFESATAGKNYTNMGRVDALFKLQTGCLKFVFLNRFIQDLLVCFRLLCSKCAVLILHFYLHIYLDQFALGCIQASIVSAFYLAVRIQKQGTHFCYDLTSCSLLTVASLIYSYVIMIIIDTKSLYTVEFVVSDVSSKTRELSFL